MSDSPPDRATLHAVFYSWTTEYDSAVRDVYPQHRRDVDQFGQDGRLWMIGLFDAAGHDSEVRSALAIFRDAGAAQRFAQEDPLFLPGFARVDGIRVWSPLIYAQHITKEAGSAHERNT